jgi:hypothetical protein
LRTFVFGANHMRSRARAYRWDKLRRTFTRTRTAVGFSGRSSPSAPHLRPPTHGAGESPSTLSASDHTSKPQGSRIVSHSRALR